SASTGEAAMKVGINPIAWCNGDFPDLQGGEPFPRCLSEIRRAGYAGTELGHGFPSEPRALRAALDAHELELVSGWYPSFVLSRGEEGEARACGEFVRFLAAAGGRYAVVAELARCVQRDRAAPLRFGGGPGVLSREEWDRLARGVERLAAIAREHGVTLAYHPHMGTVVQEASQVRELVERTSDAVR